MYTISVDHGTNNGIAIFNGSKLIHYDNIRLDSVTSLKDAYRIFGEFFGKYIPNVVVIEKVNIAGNKFGGVNVIKLAQLQAILILLAQQYNAKVIEVNPMSVKKFTTGNGHAEKEEVAKSVSSVYGIPYKSIIEEIPFKRKIGIQKIEYEKSDAIANGYFALSTQL